MTTGSKFPIITSTVVVVEDLGNEYPFHPDRLLPRAGGATRADADPREAPAITFDWPDS